MALVKRVVGVAAIGAAVAAVGCGGASDGATVEGSVAEAVVAQGRASCPVPQAVRSISGHTTPPLPVGGTAVGSGKLQLPEIPKEARPAEVAGPQQGDAIATTQTSETVTHRSMSRHHRRLHDPRPPAPLTVPIVRSSPVFGANAALGASFDGLDMRDQRLANGGNQFSVEPPDQGLCAGNGFILESTNDVLRVFDDTGAPLTGVIDLNTFYGYPAQFDRTTGLEGPFVTDPSCLFDADTQRWYHVVLTLDVDPASGNFLGANHIDIAVSTSADPRGSWVIRKLPVQDDGTEGTPNHGCSLGPCIGDFPHIGADRNGFFVTTNEYSLNGPEFIAAQVYAFSKAALASNAASVNVVEFNTAGSVKVSGGTQPGFTVWPATSAAKPSRGRDRGESSAEFFLSSNAAEEASAVAGGTFSNQIVAWAASNTTSLDSASPCVALNNTVLRSEVYGIPPQSDQKAGNIPLADCLNADCLGLGAPETPEVEGGLDSSDSRMFQVSKADDLLFSSLGTVVKVGGEERAGVAFFVVNAEVEDKGRVEAHVIRQGYVAVAGNNVTYPAVAVSSEATGVMAFTLVGKDHFPSAGYASVSPFGVGELRVAAEGKGPQDGFSEYKTFGDPPRPRWGDYGAAVVDGRNVWIASEYVAQTCDFATFLADPSCGGTRVILGNWATRISAVKPW
jgi:hypothetical protein